MLFVVLASVAGLAAYVVTRSPHVSSVLTFRKRDFFEKTKHNVAACRIEMTDVEDPNEGLSSNG